VAVVPVSVNGKRFFKDKRRERYDPVSKWNTSPLSRATILLLTLINVLSRFFR
jgi:hypothetical protein